MSHANIVASVRTPVGRRGGSLAQMHPSDLGAVVLRALVSRSGISAEDVDDVIWGCVAQVGPQGANLGRTTVLAAGLPESVPATTIDRQCGSSQQALHFAAQAVASGSQDLVIAGGTEVMSQVPLGSSARAGIEAGMASPWSSAGWQARYGDQEVSQFRGAELIAERWSLARAEMEELAVRSHELAIQTHRRGAFAEETVEAAGLTADEGPRSDATLERLAALAPLRDGGRLTAALASQISDGSAAVLVASDGAVERLGLEPIARVRAMVVVGSDPITMLTGPIAATTKVLDRAGLTIADIGTFEVNEAFASVLGAWLKATGASLDRVNPAGGAMALGHPLGATGARLMTSMLHRMRREGLRFGLQTMCEGGGMANATIVEMLG